MIWYSVHESKFSAHTVVASTKRGICATLFSYNKEAAEIELAKMFPGHELEFESVRNLNYAFGFVEALDQNADVGKFDIDIICGTALQRLVWQCLREIPRGTTIVYSELASMIDMPKAVRSIASACGKNPISVIIPCHRIVPKVGGIGKYRWGADMKRTLLNMEKYE